jgi:hypothetical protein
MQALMLLASYVASESVEGIRQETERRWHMANRAHQRGEYIETDKVLDEIRGQLDLLASSQGKSPLNEQDIFQTASWAEHQPEASGTQHDDPDAALDDTGAVVDDTDTMVDDKPQEEHVPEQGSSQQAPRPSNGDQVFSGPYQNYYYPGQAW